MAAFSRLQLAAALLEYDNDSENPNALWKSAHDSAIFSHLRKANGNIYAAKGPAHNADGLGVKLPSESGTPSDVGGDMTRRSKASIDMLHNPFGGDEEEEPEEDDLEVDLASWGLDSLIPEEKQSKKSKGRKGKPKSDVLPNTVGIGPRPGGDRMAHSRTMSMPLAEFGKSGAFLDSSTSGGRRNTISSPLNLTEDGVLEKPRERQRFSSHPLIENLSVSPPLVSLSSYDKRRDTVPFPSSSPMPGQTEANASSGSRPMSRLNALSEDEPNPFAIPPPPPSRASRFDPKFAAHARTTSNTTRLSVAPQLAYNGENENDQTPRTLSRASVVDVRSARDRRLSTASFGTRDMLDDDYQSAYGGEEYPARERRYSRLDLMRPKILVMPSPLQTDSTASPVPKGTRTREGFLDSTDGRPLPPGARASARMSMLGPSLTSNVPVAANSFTPNPRISLSASQLLFRNNLMVDGQRDVTYNDIDGNLQRAVEDGEQVKLDFPELPERPEVAAPSPAPPEEATRSKPSGKLYGRSLIDDLEARKQEMRSKKRVFTGDQRPSMMDRATLNRSSTLIDPASLPSRPTASRMPSSQTDTSLVRRGSRGGKPLLAIDDDGKIAETGGLRESKMAQTKSVFGVDTLWEREMAKLNEIEAQERLQREEEKRREEEEELKKPKKKKRKGKGKGGELEVEPDRSTDVSPYPASPAVSSSVSPQVEPTPSLSLPDIPTVVSRKRIIPVPGDDESDCESSASEAAAPGQNAVIREGLVDQWVSDDEKKPVLVSKVGLGNAHISFPPEEDSDEDLPLSVTLQRATQKLTIPKVQPDEDSDEDRPLSMMLLNKSSLASFKIPSSGFSEPAGKSPEDNKSDDDNVPLGIRASRLPAGASQLAGLSGLSAGGNHDDDDRPLSMHPAQVRKSQFQMLAQAQQQQMFQAQMTSSMVFPHPSSMMFMMPSPAPFASQPPPMQEANKFNSVDRWRHDVAVEGQP